MIDINRLLDEARRLGCSDVHLTVGLPPIVRLHGELRKLSMFNEQTNDAILEVAKYITTSGNMDKINANEDADFSYVSKSGYRHRVNVFHQRGNVAIAIRILRNEIPTIEDLGLPPVIKEFADRPRGLILVTGPTGSGKSTSLAAMIDYINTKRNCHIITIEDPIEYTHVHKKSMINQREVGLDVNNFSDALRSSLREDPDVILVGEMRDYETISAAITAAETGHLVMSTLHTTGAADTINRIIDVFPAHQQSQIRTQLASTLVGVVSQTLVQNCAGDGRVAATEVLIATDAVSAMIRENKVHMITTAIQTGRSMGMMSLDQCLAQYVKDRKIRLETAYDVCMDVNDIRNFLGLKI